MVSQLFHQSGCFLTCICLIDLSNFFFFLLLLFTAEGAENGLEFTIVRPFNWIGPRMDFIPGIDGPSEGVPRVLACFSNVSFNICHNMACLVVFFSFFWSLILLFFSTIEPSSA